MLTDRIDSDAAGVEIDTDDFAPPVVEVVATASGTPPHPAVQVGCVSGRC
jgi:hypothetical protein